MFAATPFVHRPLMALLRPAEVLLSRWWKTQIRATDGEQSGDVLLRDRVVSCAYCPYAELERTFRSQCTKYCGSVCRRGCVRWVERFLDHDSMGCVCCDFLKRKTIDEMAIHLPVRHIPELTAAYIYGSDRKPRGRPSSDIPTRSTSSQWDYYMQAIRPVRQKHVGMDRTEAYTTQREVAECTECPLLRLLANHPNEHEFFWRQRRHPDPCAYCARVRKRSAEEGEPRDTKSMRNVSHEHVCE